MEIKTSICRRFMASMRREAGNPSSAGVTPADLTPPVMLQYPSESEDEPNSNYRLALARPSNDYATTPVPEGPPTLHLFVEKRVCGPNVRVYTGSDRHKY